MFLKLKNYLKSVIEESKKIVWPNKKKLIYDSATVVAFLVGTGLAITVIDGGFTKLFQLVLERLG